MVGAIELDFAIFPRYPEECDPDQARRSCVPLAWLAGQLYRPSALRGENLLPLFRSGG